MKRIKNADINFKLNPKRINLKNFSMRFYTVNSQLYFFIKDQDDVVSVEREATIYDDPEVIISGGTVAVDYYLPLDWSELVQLGEGVLNFRCINNIDDPFFPDLVYNKVVEDTTPYYIDSDIHIDPSEDDKNLIERVVELESNLAIETADREDADVFLSGAVENEIARAISADTELSERISYIESGTTGAIEAEKERAIAQENAIRQDLTDETELRSSADTAIWTAINNDIQRSVSADTALDTKIDDYIISNNTALQLEIQRASSAETKIANDLQAEVTRAINSESSITESLTNEISRATSVESELRATAAENLSTLTTAITNEKNRAEAKENALDAKFDSISGVVGSYIISNNTALANEVTRAISAETALSNKIDADVDAEETRAISAETAIATNLADNYYTKSEIEETNFALSKSINDLNSRLIDNYHQIGLTNTKVDELSGKVTSSSSAIDTLRTALSNEVLRAIEEENAISGALDTYKTSNDNALSNEVTRALSAETVISGKLDTYISTNNTALSNEVARATEKETAIETKTNTVSGNVINEIARATSAETALDNKIDILDARFFDDAKYEDSGNTKVINFYNGSTIKATIDCTDFIKDGMLDSVSIVNGNLVFVWNTDSGKQTVSVPLTDIFNPDNYYTKIAIDEIVSGINASITNEVSARTAGDTVINNKITTLSGEVATKLSIDDFNSYSGNIYTKSEVDTAIANVDVSDQLVNYYTKSETYSKTEVDTAIANVDVSDQLANYLLISAFTAYSASVESEKQETDFAVSKSINDLNSRLIDTNRKTDNVITSNTVLSGKVDTYISSNDSAVSNLNTHLTTEVNRATTNENRIETKVDNSVASVASLEARVAVLEALVRDLKNGIDTGAY